MASGLLDKDGIIKMEPHSGQHGAEWCTRLRRVASGIVGPTRELKRCGRPKASRWLIATRVVQSRVAAQSRLLLHFVSRVL